MSTEKVKTGVFTGSYAVNRLNGDRVPILIGDYVLLTYGTGIVMGVPGARPARLRVRQEIRSAGHGRRRAAGLGR